MFGIDSIGQRAASTAELIRNRLTGATLSLFDHAPYPLENTLDYRDDPGLLGADSTSWRLIADPAAFVGGIRGLLVQAAHPEVVAGVGDHSRYRDDPLGRLSRTSAYVTATTFGAQPEVDQAVRVVRRAHGAVKGVSSRGVSYDAANPAHAAWVHNALTDSFLTANQWYGGNRLSDLESDRFVSEQSRIGALLGAEPLPDSAGRLSNWVANHPDVAPSPQMREVVQFLTDPPLSPGIRFGYLVLLEAAIATLPDRLTEILGLRPKPAAALAGQAAVKSLRWVLGYSPSWALALIRVGHDLPEGMFRRLPDVPLDELPNAWKGTPSGTPSKSGEGGI